MVSATSPDCVRSTATAGGWPGTREPAQIIRKSPIRADSEPEYDKLAREPLVDLGLVHLRWATPGLGVNEQNSHPFRYGDYVVRAQRRHPPAGPAAPDAAAAVGAPASRHDRQRAVLPAHHVATCRAMAETWSPRSPTRSPTSTPALAPNSLNAILLSPDKLYAISWHHRDRVAGSQAAGKRLRRRRDRGLLRPGLPRD